MGVRRFSECSFTFNGETIPVASLSLDLGASAQPRPDPVPHSFECSFTLNASPATVRALFDSLPPPPDSVDMVARFGEQSAVRRVRFEEETHVLGPEWGSRIVGLAVSGPRMADGRWSPKENDGPAATIGEP